MTCRANCLPWWTLSLGLPWNAEFANSKVQKESAHVLQARQKHCVSGRRLVANRHVTGSDRKRKSLANVHRWQLFVMQGAGIYDSLLLGTCRLSLSEIISLTGSASRF